MTDWGRHGVATADMWDRFFRTVVNPTTAFASGALARFNDLPPATYLPFAQELADDVMVRSYGATMTYSRDQSVLTGGPIVDQDAVGTRDTVGVYPVSVQGHNVTRNERLNIADRVFNQEITWLQYPWRFYKFGQDYLTRLLAVKPPLSASIEARMIWAVDVAWWINMMLASTNVYPSWIPDALGRILGGNAWPLLDYVPDSSDLSTVPELSPGRADAGYGFYPMPFAQHPGQFNHSGVVRDRAPSSAMVPSAPSAPMVARLQRWATLRPWWVGVQTFGAFDVQQRRAQQEDPDMAANLLRAAGQHSFFSESGTQRAGDFFETVHRVQVNSGARNQLETFTERIAPAWLATMQAIPYWSLVRAGNDSWSYYSSGVEIQTDKNQFHTPRFPMTAEEARRIKHGWEIRERDAHVLAAFTTYFQTMYAAIMAEATGTVGPTQYNALVGWYALATWKYREPKIWERTWEPPPIVVRMVKIHDCLVRYEDNMCSVTVFGPDSRVGSVGDGLVYAGAALKVLSQRGDIALTVDAAKVAPPTVVAFEATTDRVRPLQALTQAPTQSTQATTETSVPWTPQAFPAPASKPIWPWVSAGVLAVVGIIATTRNRSR